MDPWGIRAAEERDLAGIDAALVRLSMELGDPHRTGPEALGRALFGAPPLAWAQVAERAGGIGGVVLFTPVFSTVRGGAGAFVTDLWIETALRGMGLGPKLIARAAGTAASTWDAAFLRLSVHDGNRRARELYQKLGFEPVRGETAMVLSGEAFQQVRRTG